MASHSRPVATPSPFSSFKSNTIDQERPHLSAACIRSFVKHLSSASSAARSKTRHLHTMSSATSHDQKQPQQGHEQASLKPHIKKQARRRMHTSKPYQERLLNMAEARREIVTALRIHRANMRQQSRYHHQEQHQPRLQQPVQVMFQEQRQAFEGVPVAMSYASAFSDNHWCSSPLAHLIDGSPAGNYSSSMRSYGLTPLEEAPPAIGGLEQLACTLPAQPLGLNLSFQGFGGSVDNAKNSDDPFGVALIQSSSCPASSFSVYSSPSTVHGSLALRVTEDYSSSADAQTALSPVLDCDMCLIGDGERQGTEWSGAAANVAAPSAWWTKIFESMESGGVGEGVGVPKTRTEGEVGMADDAEAAAGLLPDWQRLCDGVRVEQEVTGPNKPDALEMHVDDGEAEYSCCYEGDHSYNGGDIALPCVDIGDIEGWDDGEWFS